MYLKSLAKSVEKDRERKDLPIERVRRMNCGGIITVLPRKP